MSTLEEKWISFLEIKKKKDMNNGSVTSGVWDFFGLFIKKGGVFFSTETSPVI